MKFQLSQAQYPLPEVFISQDTPVEIWRISVTLFAPRKTRTSFYGSTSRTIPDEVVLAYAISVHKSQGGVSDRYLSGHYPALRSSSEEPDLYGDHQGQELARRLTTLGCAVQSTAGTCLIAVSLDRVSGERDRWTRV